MDEMSSLHWYSHFGHFFFTCQYLDRKGSDTWGDDVCYFAGVIQPSEVTRVLPGSYAIRYPLHSEVKVCRSVTFGHGGHPPPSHVTLPRNRWLRLSCHTALCPRPSLIIFQYVTPCQPFTATADDPSMMELVAATIRVDDRLTSRVDSHSLMAVWQPGCAYATLNPRQRCHSFEAQPAVASSLKGVACLQKPPLCHD